MLDPRIWIAIGMLSVLIPGILFELKVLSEPTEKQFIYWTIIPAISLLMVFISMFL